MQTGTEAAAANPRLYTPLQVRLGSFLGGPIASVYFLRENFRILGKASEAKTTLVWGGAFVIGLLALVPFLPTRFPNLVVPLAYSYAAGSIAEKWQMQKQAILDSGTYQVQSSWRVLGLALLFALALLVVGAGVYLCLVALGLATGNIGLE
jgi:hypothetical protein